MITISVMAIMPVWCQWRSAPDGKRLTTPSNPLNTPPRQQDAKILRQRRHHDAHEKEGNTHHDDRHPSEDMAETRKVGLKYRRREQEGRACPEGFDGCTVELSRDDGQGDADGCAV